MDKVDVLFIKESCNEIDGAQIFNRRIVSELERKGVNVQIHDVSFNRGCGFPIWLHSWSKTELDKVRYYQKKGIKIIVSHEKFFGLANYLKIDIAIYHNCISKMQSTFKVLEWLYKLGSSRIDTLIQEQSREKYVLSPRERDLMHLEGNASRLIVPGISSSSELAPQLNKVKLVNSTGWIFKRRSKVDEGIFSTRGFEIVRENIDRPMIHVIEDKFTTGTKLKLIDAVARGDALCCHNILKNDFLAFRLNPSAVFWFATNKDFDKLKDHKWDYAAIKDNASKVRSYTWSLAADDLSVVIRSLIQG